MNNDTTAVDYLASKLKDAELSLKMYRASIAWWREQAFKGKSDEEKNELIAEASRLMIYL